MLNVNVVPTGNAKIFGEFSGFVAKRLKNINVHCFLKTSEDDRSSRV